MTVHIKKNINKTHSSNKASLPYVSSAMPQDSLTRRKNHNLSLEEKYPPSEPCSCKICRAYCSRPGWWSVSEAARAVDAGLYNRMMLELSPDFTFGVLSPAFYGCEQNFALQEFSHLGCNFYKNGLCELHDTGLEPLECRFSHHARSGLGIKCHIDLEKDWDTPAGQLLVLKWMKLVGLYKD